jgi:Carboxypeptidase regulatory-like domain
MTVVVRRRAVLAGRVVDADGKPVAAARVELTAVPRSLQPSLAARRVQHGSAWDLLDRRLDRTRTDASGRFVFVDLPSGAYRVAASLPGSGSRYGTASGKAQVKRGGLAPAKLAWVDLELPRTTVTGKVTGPRSKPVRLASVQAKGSPGGTFTDAEGRYVLSGLEAGQHVLLVRARGFEPAEQSVALPTPGVTKRVNVTLTPEVA